MVILPVGLMLAQLILSGPVTRFSRNHAMKNAAGYIKDLDAYHNRYRRYPAGLQAMYKDYHPEVTGVEKYYYQPHGDFYNLSFEQPRFLLDNIGTREWLVYNPGDENRAYSHTSWFLLLTPEQLEQSQGWYDSANAGQKHWKYFLFD
ncbi:MAG: hypothetical protein R3C61_10180 [Bacteroidia bacterium]